MTNARRDGIYLLLLGNLAFLLLSIVLCTPSHGAMVDFKVVYYPARCFIEHCDPYSEIEVQRIVQKQEDVYTSKIQNAVQVLTRYIYPPTAFLFTIPIALLPMGPAHLLWLALTAGALVLASCLIWDLGADYSPILSGALVGFLLANSELVVIVGNMAGIAIGLCMLAVWCFLRERFIPLGILCLAVSLCTKPQDTGLVWLYFLLAGGVYRKRALQTLLVTVALSLPGVLWVWHVSPHWLQEWHSNILAFSAHGGMNDPGPASSGAHGLGLLVSLQPVFSLFWDDPRIYNPATYLVCAPLLLVWAFCTLRYRRSPRTTWMALAAIGALSMLPVYHRQSDAAVLLLAIPACAMLWAERNAMGRLALLVTGTGLLFTADFPWAAILALINVLQRSASGQFQKLFIAMQVFPVPLALLLVGVFYLWVYVRRCPAQSAAMRHESSSTTDAHSEDRPMTKRNEPIRTLPPQARTGA